MAGFNTARRQRREQGSGGGSQPADGGSPAGRGRGRASEGAVEAPPEEQRAYETFVGNALNVIYRDDKVAPAILRSLEGDGNPREGLADTAANVVKRLIDSAVDNGGGGLTGDVVMHGGLAIVEDLAEVQREAGIADLSEEEIEGAYYRAADRVREALQKDGTLDGAPFWEDMRAMVRANEAGNLDDVVPGAEEAAGRLADMKPPSDPIAEGEG